MIGKIELAREGRSGASCLVRHQRGTPTHSFFKAFYRNILNIYKSYYIIYI